MVAFRNGSLESRMDILVRRVCHASWLILLISRRALAPGLLDEPDASAFRLIGKLEVDRLQVVN